MPSPDDEFERAAHEKSPGLGRELMALLRHNKKWWLLPILLVLLLIGGLVIAVATKAPFIYSLF